MREVREGQSRRLGAARVTSAFEGKRNRLREIVSAADDISK